MKAINRTIILVCFVLSIFPAILTAGSKAGVKTLVRTSVSSEDTARLNNLVRKGFIGIKEKVKGGMNLDLTGAYIDSAVLLCERKKIDFPPMLHLLRAEYFYMKGDFSSSEGEAKMAEVVSDDIKEYGTQANALLFLGQYYHRTGFFRESIDHYQKAIQLSEKEGLKHIISRSHYGMANVYNTIGDLKAYRNSLQLMIETGIAEDEYRLTGSGYYHLGTSYCGDSSTAERRNFRKADSLLKKSLSYALSKKDTSITSLSLANSGWNFYLERMYDSALYYYEKSLKYSLPAKLFPYASNSLGNIGTIYRDLNDHETAIKYYQKAIDQAKKIEDLYNLQWIYMDMSNMYLKSGDTANAYITHVQFKKYSDSWIKSENAKGVTDARIRYEADTHNKELALLSLRLKNNRILNYGFIGLIILTVTIGLLLFRGSKLEDKRRITEMNHKISELTQANLRQQMNPHFIFNTLNSIQYYMYQHDKLATNTYLTKFSSLMRKILDNSSNTSIPLRDELDALILYLDLERLRFNNKFNYEINIDDEIDPLLYKVPTMLIQPYVENSICHGLMPKEDKGLVKIDMKLENSHILCTIEDNGIGRKAAQERKKMKDPSHNSLGTRIVSSRLDLVNSLYGTDLRTVYTDLKNNEGEPVGTRIEIHIPVMT